MNYVYHQDRFTLRELMTEFALSKSTALRYIQSLEDIGVPLYSEPGRYGGYRILDSYSIPPVTFTPQETCALFFSMKGMELLGSLPFKAEYDAIQHKFLQSVSPKIKNMLEQDGSRVSFGTAQLTNECPQLEKLFQAIIYPSVLREEPLPWLQDMDLSNRLDLATRSQSAIDYRIELTGEGKAIFERNHDPRMSLTETNGKSVVSGWIEPAETPYLLQYIHQFGACLRGIHPASIRESFVKELEDLKGRLTITLI
ncbi:YafY family protein [Paenibacillus sp. PAMC21692]|uniref:helix-turn-helix transcriptional regulator n=1 Tax=Paenibacillus sp. PAMC21692 TaxID=2762320 RepID=UPI0021C4104B|nr:HTH domain-containing protein [Paenibacillus sp. PAMC21692]